MLAIWKRELQAYFRTPIAYVFMGIFLLISGIMVAYYLASGSGNITGIMSSLSFVFLITVPVLTMRLFSEERRNKTDQMLITAPITVTQLVLGKYLAAMTMFAITLVCTLVYPFIITVLGVEIVSETISSYLGFFLLGAANIAIGLFISSVCENQVTSAIATLGTLMATQYVSVFTTALPGWLAKVINMIAIADRYAEFGASIIYISPIVYFITVVALMLFLTTRSIEKRRWSES